MILNKKRIHNSPQELNKCLQKVYLSARKSDDRGRSVIARQNVIVELNRWVWVKNHFLVLYYLTVLVYTSGGYLRRRFAASVKGTTSHLHFGE